MKLFTLAASVAAIALGGTAVAQNAQQITGAGSTFIYPVLSAWASEYNRMYHVQVNYQSIGSGGGISQIRAGTVDFGASDKPLSPQELAQGGLAQFPAVIGGVVPVVHINGVAAGQLRFSGAVLADIFAGRITHWNDPRIHELNPRVTLPDAQITVVHRSDGSGTTFNFTHYLSQVSPQWRSSPGEGTAVSWPTGIGGRGNEGVANYVQQTPNSIGYVEYAYVIQNHMNWAYVQNHDGRFVAPSAQSFMAAASHAHFGHAQDFFVVMTNAPGANSYPIAATTFILMHRRNQDANRTQAALNFFRWALRHGQQQALRLQYVPLPTPLADRIFGYMQQNVH